MKKILPSIALIALIILLEISWSGFFSFQERSYFFLFSFLAVWIIRKGFLRAFPLIITAAVVFEGITQSAIGPISLYAVLFSYGMSFLLKRLHLEYGGEKVFLALAAGIGMALYPIFSFEYFQGFQVLPAGALWGWFFWENIFLGAVFFLVMLRFSERSRYEDLPLANSFLK